MPEYTPWGFTNSKEVLVPGITWYDTPSHGGYHISKELLQTIPERARTGFAGYGWFEEDCDAAIVIYYFPQHFAPEQVEMAKEMIKSYQQHSSYYADTFGLIL